MALGCYEALKELGLHIPQDVAVIGYDDREIAKFMRPPLTTVLLPHFEMGTLAAEYLIDHIGRPSQARDSDQGRMSAGRAPVRRPGSGGLTGFRACIGGDGMLLVTGATGKVGTVLIERILRDPRWQGTAGSGLVPQSGATRPLTGVDIVKGDIADRASRRAGHGGASPMSCISRPARKCPNP